MKATDELVLVSVGTDHHAFTRLLDWVGEWSRAHPDVPVVVQSGATRAPAGLDVRPYLPADELRALVARASVVVCHGGPGTIAECHRAGLRPVVVPREHARGEHVDDHQVHFTERLAADAQIHRSTTRDGLLALLDESRRDPAAFRMPAGGAVDLGQSVEAFARLVADEQTRHPSRRARAPAAEEGRSAFDGTVLFIAGWGRSGSTLLARLLGSVAEVTTVGELRDLVQHGVVENRRCGCGAPFHDCPQWRQVGEQAFGGWDAVDVGELLRIRRHLDRPWWLPALASGLVPPDRRRDLAMLDDFLGRLYAAIGVVTGARVIVDSSKIASYGLLLHHAMPGRVRVAHLVRDPRGVVHSWDKQVRLPDRLDQHLRMNRYGPLAAALRYDLYNLAVSATPALRRTTVRLRYEDVVVDPAPHVARLLQHAGLQPTPDDLAHLGASSSLQLGPHHTVDGNPMRFDTGTVVLRDDQAWRAELSPGRRRIVALVTSPLLASYGYPTTASDVAAPTTSLPASRARST